MKSTTTYERTTTTESLLGVLSLRPMSGYEIKKMIEQSIGNFWSESFGQIYPTLKRIVAEGLAEVVEGEIKSGRERKVYTLTQAGHTRLRLWLGMPAADQVPRNELLLKLFFGDKAERGQMCVLLKTKKQEMTTDLLRFDAIEQGMAEQRKGHPGLPYWLMTVRYGKAEARALLAWCDECLETFKEMQ